MTIRHSVRLLLVAALVSSIAGQAVAGTCTMSTQMTNAQTQEQQRRLNNITTNFQQLQLLNQLQTACLENFPQFPTQWLGNSVAVTTAFNKIKQASCQQLANQARATTTQAMAQAQAAVQQQINNIEKNVTGATGGSSGLLSGAVNQVTPSSGSVISTITGSLSRLFQ
ncbi:hypothetical protein BVER_01705 [Candidatus Burkholderia verschuerenii]|uniref:Uncharacterized protein n=1 Tax=Candidatus Burkholderia verschuerenii TaxID=242163 RepID=A0A0L0MIY2_9BURK|nr:hypothetical protein [Candidatus Burkholderia verschuerenii]KND62273.1 hypothetical protein BVER_01705 [Candidatus Burkholderia verschuerenii]